MKPIADELAELRALDATALAQRYVELFERPPRCKHREWLFRRCAHRVQENRFGGLSATAKARLEQLVAQIEIPTAPPTNENGDGLTVGSELVREWRGRELRLAVTDTGYAFEGTTYGSLSAAARAVTGARWNGRVFWGVKR